LPSLTPLVVRILAVGDRLTSHVCCTDGQDEPGHDVN
jgi:hypothetical protein